MDSFDSRRRNQSRHWLEVAQSLWFRARSTEEGVVELDVLKTIREAETYRAIFVDKLVNLSQSNRGNQRKRDEVKIIEEATMR